MDGHAHGRRNENALYTLSIGVLLLALAGLLPELVAMGIAIAASGTAGFWAVERHRASVLRRRSADALLVSIPGLCVPDRLRWRAGELTSPEHRRRTAAELHRFAKMADQPILRTSVPVYLSTLRPNHDRLESTATIVEKLDQPVTPQGMVLLEQLLGAGGSSPLYRPANANELDRALRRVRGALEAQSTVQAGSTRR